MQHMPLYKKIAYRAGYQNCAIHKTVHSTPEIMFYFGNCRELLGVECTYVWCLPVFLVILSRFEGF